MRRLESGTGGLGMASLVNEKFALYADKMVWNLHVGLWRMLGTHPGPRKVKVKTQGAVSPVGVP